MTNEQMIEQARAYECLPYSIQLVIDSTVEGKRTYVALVPELPGCIAQGDTASEAMEEIRCAIRDYVLSLLEDGQAVPPPWASLTFTSTGGSEVSIWRPEVPHPLTCRGDEDIASRPGATVSPVPA